MGNAILASQSLTRACRSRLRMYARCWMENCSLPKAASRLQATCTSFKAEVQEPCCQAGAVSLQLRSSPAASGFMRLRRWACRGLPSSCWCKPGWQPSYQWQHTSGLCVAPLLLSWIWLWPLQYVQKASLQMSMFNGMSEIRPGALDWQADVFFTTRY